MFVGEVIKAVVVEAAKILVKWLFDRYGRLGRASGKASPEPESRHATFP